LFQAKWPRLPLLVIPEIASSCHYCVSGLALTATPCHSRNYLVGIQREAVIVSINYKNPRAFGAVCQMRIDIVIRYLEALAGCEG
jgi:hypothetical protein